MMPVPSMSLLEILILAGCAGLVLLIGAAIAALVATRRKQSRAQSNDTSANGNTDGEQVTARKKKSRSQGLWIGIVILILLALCILPLLAVAGGVLLVTPFKSTRTEAIEVIGPTIEAVEVRMTPAASVLPNETAPGAASPDAPQTEAPSTANPRAGLGLSPFSRLTLFGLLPGIAGLALLLGAAAVAPISKAWRQRDAHLNDPRTNGDRGGKRSRMATLRYGLLGFAFWLALSIFLILDLSGSVSLYFRFVAIYAAFWALVGALLLYDRSRREKILILSLFALALFSVRFVDWNSRKPFLRDFHRIKEGMTVAQVKQIMGDYGIGGGNPLALDGQKTELNEQGDIVAGGITFQHTKEDWGNSDWGVVIFEDGRVVQTEFLPD